MISALPAPPEARERPEGAAVLIFPVRAATVPGGIRVLRGGGPFPSRERVLPPFAPSVHREELEEEILALWEG